METEQKITVDHIQKLRFSAFNLIDDQQCWLMDILEDATDSQASTATIDIKELWELRKALCKSLDIQLKVDDLIYKINRP